MTAAQAPGSAKSPATVFDSTLGRSEAFSRFLDNEHFRYRACGREPRGDHYVFSSPAGLRFEGPDGPVWRRTRADLQEFFRVCFGVALRDADGSADLVCRCGDDPADESFVLDVQPAGVTAVSPGPRGLLQASHYLERTMADAGGGWLPLGRVERRPALNPRFTEGAFIPGVQTAENPGQFSDAYLGLMSHYGANALKIYADLFALWRSEALPALNTPNFAERADRLRQFAVRLAGHGLDLYLHLNTHPRDRDHELFAAHPETRGSRMDYSIEELSGRALHALCSSSPRVLQAYRETLSAIFAAVPELAGAVMIIGGECFCHCFTRASAGRSGETDCPQCRGRDAHREVASLVNVVRGALPRGKRLFAWPYSAFVWSGHDRMQSRWIAYLDPGVDVMANFDCFDEDELCGTGARFFDYNIKLIGPSSVFRAQRDACRARGLQISAKTETDVTPDAFFVPYLPLYFRWFDRFKAIRESGAAGYMGQWRFYGMNGTIPEELQYHSVWNPERPAGELLDTIARRDFGLDDSRAHRAVEAWRALSASWDDFPYSAMTSGERDAYMRGPWYLGPAHPLILNPQNRYGLGARFFTPIVPYLVEMLSKEEQAALQPKPKYTDDLLICLPFGVESYLRFIRRCRDRWDKGLASLHAAFGDQPNERALLELGVCETVGIHLHTLSNTVAFLELRDRMGRHPHTPESLDGLFAELAAVVDSEIANASRSLPILARDPRIGYTHTYGDVYDAEMVRQKLHQCRRVREVELPRFRSFLDFHVWQK